MKFSNFWSDNSHQVAVVKRIQDDNMLKSQEEIELLFNFFGHQQPSASNHHSRPRSSYSLLCIESFSLTKPKGKSHRSMT
jgi:hypothetical protein